MIPRVPRYGLSIESVRYCYGGVMPFEPPVGEWCNASDVFDLEAERDALADVVRRLLLRIENPEASATSDVRDAKTLLGRIWSQR